MSVKKRLLGLINLEETLNVSAQLQLQVLLDSWMLPSAQEFQPDPRGPCGRRLALPADGKKKKSLD